MRRRFSPLQMRLVEVKDRTMIGPTEFFMLLMLAVAGLLTAIWGGNRFGCVGYVLGLPVGIVAMFSAIYAAALSWVYVEGLLFDGVPWLPACRKGRCKGGRLAEFGDYHSIKIDRDRWVFRCRCGDTFKKVGRRFVEVAPDGSFRPYLVWSTIKGWSADKESQVG